MKKRNCPFCYTDSSSSLEVLEYDWSSVGSRLLDTCGEISLCAGLGAIVSPYIIAFPKRHRLSISELSPSERLQLLDALDLCLYSGLFPSNSLCVFEHGGKSFINSTACIEHAHLHIVDGQHMLSSYLFKCFQHAEEAAITIDTTFTADSGYLFTGLYTPTRSIKGYLVRTASCGSQFFRRALAHMTHSINWNWKLSPEPKSALNLCSAWRNHCRGEQELANILNKTIP